MKDRTIRILTFFINENKIDILQREVGHPSNSCWLSVNSGIKNELSQYLTCSKIWGKKWKNSNCFSYIHFRLLPASTTVDFFFLILRQLIWYPEDSFIYRWTCWEMAKQLLPILARCEAARETGDFTVGLSLKASLQVSTYVMTALSSLLRVPRSRPSMARREAWRLSRAES